MGFTGGFWATVELLVALEATTHSLFDDEVEDWLENVSSKVQLLKGEEELMGKNASIGDDAVDYGNLVDCSFSFPAVRSRLELLMGSNVVRLTDRKYMLKLMSRIREEHENQQKARIQERKTHELMRTKKMILNRFITVQEAPPEIRQYPLFQLYLYCDSIAEKRHKKRVAKKVKMSKSLYRLLYPGEESVDTNDDMVSGEDFEEDNREEVPMKEVVIDGVLQIVPLSPAELEAVSKEKEISQEMNGGYMFTKEEYDNLHYEADSIKRLKESRTINEMYTKAHDIVGLLYTLTGNDKRKRCTTWQEETAEEVPE